MEGDDDIMMITIGKYTLANVQDIEGRERLVIIVDREMFHNCRIKEVKRLFWKGHICGLFAAGCSLSDPFTIYVNEDIYKEKEVLNVLLMHEYAHLHLQTIDEEMCDEYVVTHIENGKSRLRKALEYLHSIGGEDYSIACTDNGWVLGDELHPDPYIRDTRYLHREKYFR